MFSETFYVDAALDPGARLPLPDDHEDRGLYIVEGEITVAGQVFEAGRMLVFRPGDRIAVGAGPTGARLLLLGGATLEGPRYIWWNFVASSQEKIEAAKEAWRRRIGGASNCRPTTATSSSRRLRELGDSLRALVGEKLLQHRRFTNDSQRKAITEFAERHFARSASTPGSALPSIHSRNAPPAVET